MRLTKEQELAYDDLMNQAFDIKQRLRDLAETVDDREMRREVDLLEVCLARLLDVEGRLCPEDEEALVQA